MIKKELDTKSKYSRKKRWREIDSPYPKEIKERDGS